jgi:hypothetical protein
VAIPSSKIFLKKISRAEKTFWGPKKEYSSLGGFAGSIFTTLHVSSRQPKTVDRSSNTNTKTDTLFLTQLQDID